MHVHITIEREVVEARGNFGDCLLPVMPIKSCVTDCSIRIADCYIREFNS